MAAENPDFRRFAKLLRPKVPRVEDLPKSRKGGKLLMTPRVRGTRVEVVQTPVPVRLIRPEKAAAGPGPAMLWIHGGGYVGGRARMDDRACSRYARDLGIPVASVEYRVAPEDPFPAPLDDCFTALEWLCRQPWADPKRIVIGGASAGGGLAAALVQRAVDAGIEVCFQLLVYPMLDDRVVGREDISPDDHLVWNTVNNRFGWQCYLGIEPGGDELPAYAAPGRRTDLAGLPPAWIGVGTADLFYDEDVDYARRLEAAGVACRLVIVPNGIHAFERLVWWRESAKDFVASQIASVREALVQLQPAAGT